MSEAEAIAAVYMGHPVQCSAEEYKDGLRTAIQQQAATWLDQKQDIRAIIALEEVRRLDAKFDFQF